MLSAEGLHYGLSFWREMANFPVEEGGTIHAVDTQTRWNRYHNMFFMNINTTLDIEVSLCCKKLCAEHIAKFNNLHLTFYIFFSYSFAKVHQHVLPL